MCKQEQKCVNSKSKSALTKKQEN